MEYEHDMPTVDAWLNSGGAEIVLETIRHLGWRVEVTTGDGWPYVDGVVVVGSREGACMEICGDIPASKQAVLAAMVDGRYNPLRDEPLDYNGRRKEFLFPMIRASDKFREESIYCCYSFIDQIRIASEATIACMGAMKSV